MGFTVEYLRPEEIAKRRIEALLKKIPAIPAGIFVMGTIPISSRIEEDAILLLNEDYKIDEISIPRYRKDIVHHTFAKQIKKLAQDQFNWSVWIY